jgi:NAD+ synthase (glutamine-hydrolysing)
VAQLRLALGQINVTVGAIDANADLILARTRDAAARGAHLVAFPEMALTGYPVEDLALRRSFQEASRRALAHLATRLAEAGLGEVTVIVG